MVRLYSAITEVRRFCTHYTDTRGPIYSAYAAFFTIMAVIPLLMFLLGLIHLLPFTQQDLIEIFSNIIPETFMPMLSEIVEELYAKSSTTLLSITAVTTLWSASKGVYGIMQGLNSVYDIPNKRNAIVTRLIAFFYTFMFIVVILFTLVFMVYGNQLQELMIHWLPFLNYFSSLITFLRSSITILLLALFFMIIYTVFPYSPQPFAHQAPGALVASIGWILFSFLFSIYVDNFSNYSYMYGSLTTIILLMLWLNICMNILFLGGAINSWLMQGETA